MREFSRNPLDGLGATSSDWLGSIVDASMPPIDTVATGDRAHPFEARYGIGRYRFTDDKGLKNGMVYFYDVTAFARRKEPVSRTIITPDGVVSIVIDHWVDVESGGVPSATEAEAVVPRWEPSVAVEDVFVVPNPYVAGRQPAGWDLAGNDADPTGTRIAFAGLPEGSSTIRIYTLAGDLVQTLEHDSRTGGGTAFWNLITRSGQDVASGVYLYAVTSGKETSRGRLVIIR